MGFKNEVINNEFDGGIVDIIITHLTKCSGQMKVDCTSTGNLLRNNEDSITNRLIDKYLNAEPNYFRYEAQSPENFDDGTDCYIGRTDIKVVSSDYFRDAQAYHVIECKRIDGSYALNKKYITDGVARFLYPGEKPKYSSFYMQNIMFGYVVQAIDIPVNKEEIKDMQDRILENVEAKDFLLLRKNGSNYYVYSCQYQTSERSIELRHLFYNFSMVIRN